MRTILFLFGICAFCNSSYGQIINTNISTKKTVTTGGGFTQLKSGLEYKIIHGPGKGNSPKATDIVVMNINVHVGDSELFNSKKLNNNEPVSFPISKPTFHGDPVEGFMLMKAGDSAVFLVPVDSLKKTQSQLQPWMKPGQKIEYNVTMFSVKPAAVVKAEAEKKSKTQTIIDDEKLSEYFSKNNIKAIKTPSGLYYTISKIGTGSDPKSGQTVTVNYTGKTMDGKVFDSNVDSNYHHVTPFTFVLGKHQVITGWDKGIPMIKKGGKGTIYIPSPMAYGEQSPSAAIPANSVLIFDIEVTEIK